MITSVYERVLRRSIEDVETVDELHNQVYNLSLYLAYVRDKNPELWTEMMDHFSGMGGFGNV